MANEREVTVRVNALSQEIGDTLNYLYEFYSKSPKNKRVARLICDGEKFLRMIGIPPYESAKTVGQLKKTISAERNKLKVQFAGHEPYLSGHQYNIFEEEGKAPPKEVEPLIEEEAKRLQAEIKWLQKALGICSNKNYFKV